MTKIGFLEVPFISQLHGRTHLGNKKDYWGILRENVTHLPQDCNRPEKTALNKNLRITGIGAGFVYGIKTGYNSTRGCQSNSPLQALLRIDLQN